eukprot:SAG31_NODE_20951_length_561_cov_0.906926_1_plen_44_part_01
MHTLAGLSGRGNGFSDVLSMYLAGKIAGVVSRIEEKWGEAFMQR